MVSTAPPPVRVFGNPASETHRGGRGSGTQGCDNAAMTQRRKLQVAGGVLLAIVLLAGGLFGFDRWSGRKLRNVPMPSAGAGPHEVVVAYLDAMDAHDCETAGALATPDYRESARSTCRKIASVDFAVDPPYESAAALRASSTTYVGVDWDIDWRWLHQDVSMEEGAGSWGYGLERASRQSPWRISSAGVG